MDFSKLPTPYCSFDDLDASNIVKSRATLSRWQKRLGFPMPVKLGLAKVSFVTAEVIDWCARRDRESRGRAA